MSWPECETEREAGSKSWPEKKQEVAIQLETIGDGLAKCLSQRM